VCPSCPRSVRFVTSLAAVFERRPFSLPWPSSSSSLLAPSALFVAHCGSCPALHRISPFLGEQLPPRSNPAPRAIPAPPTLVRSRIFFHTKLPRAEPPFSFLFMQFSMNNTTNDEAVPPWTKRLHALSKNKSGH
jgi:hypothetical protein